MDEDIEVFKFPKIQMQPIDIFYEAVLPEFIEYMNRTEQVLKSSAIFLYRKLYESFLEELKDFEKNFDADEIPFLRGLLLNIIPRFSSIVENSKSEDEAYATEFMDLLNLHIFNLTEVKETLKISLDSCGSENYKFGKLTDFLNVKGMYVNPVKHSIGTLDALKFYNEQYSKLTEDEMERFSINPNIPRPE